MGVPHVDCAIAGKRRETGGAFLSLTMTGPCSKGRSWSARESGIVGWVLGGVWVEGRRRSIVVWSGFGIDFLQFRTVAAEIPHLVFHNERFGLMA